MPNNTSAQSIFEVLVTINQINYSLQLDQNEEAIAFDYQISDVRDISSRQQAKTINLSFPYNTHNSLVFDNILSVNAQSLNFDSNSRTPVTVLVDTIEVFTGYLQVTQGAINLAKQTALVETTLVSGNMDFWTLVGEGYLTDLDLSQLNHRYGSASQTASWYSDYRLGYFYPLIDYGYGWQDISNMDGQPQQTSNVGYISFNSVFANQLFPATYVKTIVDKIFLSTATVSIANDGTTYSTQPWGYTSSFFNSDLYENLLIPFSKGAFTLSGNYGLQYEFSAGLDNNNSTFSTTFTLSDVPYSNGYGTLIGPYGNSSGAHSLNGYVVPINDVVFPYGNDPHGYWNTTDFYYQNTTSDFINVSFKCTVTLADLQFGVNRNQFAPIAMIFRSKDINGNDSPFWTDTITATGTGEPFPTDPMGWPFLNLSSTTGQTYLDISIVESILQYNWETKTTDGSPINPQLVVIPSFDYLIAPGEKIRLVIYMTPPVNLSSGYNFNWGFTGGPRFSNSGSFPYTGISLIPSPTIALGQTINYSNVLPVNIKKKDFFTSIVKMFNLYIEPDKLLPNTLRIEPRDDYYQNGEILDWSPSGGNKLDASQDITIDLLSNTQDRTTLFTYKEDKDYFNTAYQKYYNQIYGQYIYIRDNQFSTSQGKIDCIFSPTPIVQVTSSDIIVPKFDTVTFNNQNTQIAATDVNIRIVQRYVNPGITGVTGSGLLQNQYGQWSYVIDNKWVQQSIVNLPSGSLYRGIWSPNFSYQVGDIVLQPAGNGWYFICYTDIAGNPSNSDPGSSGGIPNWSFFSYGFQQITMSASNGYPYVGNFDNPYAPSVDINWSTTEALYYDTSLITDSSGIGNNLINLFYANQLAQQSTSTSKMITCEMYLTPQDINQLYLNSKIYLEIDGEPSYYIINSIKNFDPSQRTTCTVELLTATDIQVDDINPVALNNILYHKSSSGNIQTNSGNNVNASGSLVVGRANVVGGSNIIIVGDNSAINNSKNVQVVGQANNLDNLGISEIFGNNNRIGNGSKILNIGDNNVSLNTKREFIFGDNNYIVGSSSMTDIFVAGNYATISGTISNITIFGDHVIATQSVTMYINQSVKFGPSSSITGVGTPETMAYFNSAGQLSSIFNVNDANGNSLAEGFFTTALGFASHAEGRDTKALNLTDHAEGFVTVANGGPSHAEGLGTSAEGQGAHAEGIFASASGIASHAGGQFSFANNYGEWSRSSGNTTNVPGDFQYGILSYIGNNVPNTGSIIFLDGISVNFSPLNGNYYCRISFIVKDVGNSTFVSFIDPVSFLLSVVAGVPSMFDNTGTPQTSITFGSTANTNAVNINPSVTLSTIAVVNTFTVQVINIGVGTMNIIGKVDYLHITP